MLAHLAEDVELLRIAVIGLVVDMLELDDCPPLKAGPVDKSRRTCASAGRHEDIFVVLLGMAAEAALYFESVALVIQMLVLDESTVSHAPPNFTDFIINRLNQTTTSTSTRRKNPLSSFRLRIRDTTDVSNKPETRIACSPIEKELKFACVFLAMRSAVNPIRLIAISSPMRHVQKTKLFR